MVQTFLVVCCHACGKFQVDQEKKAKRWQCKVCGEKQSLQRIYARSHSAKDCRQVVQQYNTARGAVEAEDTERALEEAYAVEEQGYSGTAAEEWATDHQGWGDHAGQEDTAGAPRQQRWLEFAEDAEDDQGCTVVVPERGGKQKRGVSAATAGQPGQGSKRRRQQEQAQEDEPGWGVAPVGGTFTSGQAIQGIQPGHSLRQEHWRTQQQQPHQQWQAQPQPGQQHRGRPRQQQPQQHWGAQQPPLGDHNIQASRAMQVPSCQSSEHGWHAQQCQPSQPWQVQQHGQHAAQTQQVVTQAQVHAEQLPVPQQTKQPAGKWGTFVDDDDW